MEAKIKMVRNNKLSLYMLLIAFIIGITTYVYYRIDNASIESNIILPTDSDNENITLEDTVKSSSDNGSLDIKLDTNKAESTSSNDNEWSSMFTDDNFNDQESSILESVGLNPNNVTINVDNLNDGSDTVAKAVTQYKTLADAESDMGYYLGFHNTIESVPELSLVGMYSIGNGEWYQALFESSTNDDENAVHNITVKTSMVDDKSKLMATYNIDSYEYKTTRSIQGVDIDFIGESDDNINVVALSISNGKAYTIYTSLGNSYDVMYSIANELVINLQSMDDWI